MIYQIEIKLNKNIRDRHGEHLRRDIADIGIKDLPAVKYLPVYKIDGGLDEKEINIIASGLLHDPVTENFNVSKAGCIDDGNAKKDKSEIEVWLRPGVTDTVAESVIKAVRDLGINKNLKVKTGHKFVFEGKVTQKILKQIAERLLVNPMIQEFTLKA